MRAVLTTAVVALVATTTPVAAIPAVGGGAGLEASTTDGLHAVRFSTFVIRDQLEFHGYRDIGKITFNGFTYVTTATDREGRRVKLYIDPDTAKVLKKKIYK